MKVVGISGTPRKGGNTECPVPCEMNGLFARTDKPGDIMTQV